MNENILAKVDHLSYSSVSLWNSCPKGWWLKYVAQVPQTSGPALIFGTAAHNAIESDMLNHTEVAHKVFAEELHEAYMQQRDFMDMTEDAYDKLEAQGTAILSDPMVRFVIGSVEAVAIERKVEFYVPGVPVPVVGYIDFIEKDGVPGDIKTSWNDWGYTRASEELQPNFYLYAMDVLKIAEEIGLDGLHGGRFRHLVVVKNEQLPRAYIIETERDDYVQVVESAVQGLWEGVEQQRWLDEGLECHNTYCPCHKHKDLLPKKK